MIEVRPLATLEELHDAVRLQQSIWGFADIDLIPPRMFVVAGKIGGQVLGAFDGAGMIAFLIAIPGLRPGGKSYLHSHMLGVLPEYRDRGVGRALKLAQRQDALARGVDLIEWTFDPLELKNAFFNIERLGAIVRRYSVNQYGTTTSRLHGGLATDRCIAEWQIASPRVEAVLRGGSVPRASAAERIEVPNDIGTIRFEDPPRAKQIQERTRERFLAAFSKDLAVTGFERSEKAGTYLLEPWDSN